MNIILHLIQQEENSLKEDMFDVESKSISVPKCISFSKKDLLQQQYQNRQKLTFCFRWSYIKKSKIDVFNTQDGAYKEGGELDLSVFPELEVDCEFKDVWGEPDPLEQFNMEDIFEIETA